MRYRGLNHGLIIAGLVFLAGLSQGCKEIQYEAKDVKLVFQDRATLKPIPEAYVVEVAKQSSYVYAIHGRGKDRSAKITLCHSAQMYSMPTIWSETEYKLFVLFNEHRDYYVDHYVLAKGYFPILLDQKKVRTAKDNTYTVSLIPIDRKKRKMIRESKTQPRYDGPPRYFEYAPMYRYIADVVNYLPRENTNRLPVLDVIISDMETIVRSVKQGAVLETGSFDPTPEEYLHFYRELRKKHQEPDYKPLQTYQIGTPDREPFYKPETATAKAKLTAEDYQKLAIDSPWERLFTDSLKQLDESGKAGQVEASLVKAVRTQSPGPGVERAIGLLRWVFLTRCDIDSPVKSLTPAAEAELKKLIPAAGKDLKTLSDANLVLLTALSHVVGQGPQRQQSLQYLNALLAKGPASPWYPWAYWERIRRFGRDTSMYLPADFSTDHFGLGQVAIRGKTYYLRPRQPEEESYASIAARKFIDDQRKRTCKAGRWTPSYMNEAFITLIRNNFQYRMQLIFGGLDIRGKGLEAYSAACNYFDQKWYGRTNKPKCMSLRESRDIIYEDLNKEYRYNRPSSADSYLREINALRKEKAPKSR